MCIRTFVIWFIVATIVCWLFLFIILVIFPYYYFMSSIIHSVIYFISYEALQFNFQIYICFLYLRTTLFLMLSGDLVCGIKKQQKKNKKIEGSNKTDWCRYYSRRDKWLMDVQHKIICDMKCLLTTSNPKSQQSFIIYL